MISKEQLFKEMAQVARDIAALMDATTSTLEATMDTVTNEELTFRKGYSAAITDVSDIMKRCAERVDIENKKSD